MNDVEEHIVTGYRPDLVKRIWSFAKPHSRFLAFALFSLIIATVAEVLVPVIIQRTIDRQILVYQIRVPERSSPIIPEHYIVAATDDWVYFREEDLDKLGRTRRSAIEETEGFDPRHFTILTDPTLIEAGTPAAVDVGDGFSVVLRDDLLALPRQEKLAAQESQIRAIRRNALLFLLVLFLGLIGSFGQVYLTAYTGQLIMRDLRISLFSRTMKQSLRFLQHQPIGRLVTRVTNDVETINELFTSVLAELVKNISLMIAVIITLFSIHSRLAAWVVVSILPVIIVTEIFRRRARNAFRRVRKAVSAVNGFLSEYISGMAVVQMFVQQRRSRETFGKKNTELLRANLYDMYIFAFFRPIIDLFSTVSTAAVLFFGARYVQQNLISIGVLIAFTNLIRRFYMPVMSISEQFTVLQSALAGSERVFALMDEQSTIPDTGTAVIPSQILGKIEFDDVHFSYKESEPVIRGLDFSVEPGKLVAIVGYTGAGKTTIINLLTRLWDIQSGSIRIDGISIRDWPLSRLRTSVQQIQQDVFLFSESIRENISLGMNVSDETIWQACEAVQVADFIRDQKDGLDTVLTERGGNLSAGQRQLISFARVLVHDPPVLILDEATSSIDSETENRLQKAVQAVTGGRTSLVIAHRLSTIQHADSILVLSHGELVETGTHRQLLESGGVYATLYQLQFSKHHSSGD